MGDREFREMITCAQKGETTTNEELFDQFKLLLYKNSYINGIFSDDCFQELTVHFLECIQRFKFENSIGSAMMLKLIKEHIK